MSLRRANFGDSEDTVASVPSTWKKPKKKAEVEIQTKPVKTKNIRIQSRDKHEIGLQTEQNWTLDYLEMGMEDVLERFPSLGDFLQRAASEVEPLLHKNTVSRALQDFKVEWEDDHGETEELYTLNHRAFTSSLFPAVPLDEPRGGEVLNLDDDAETPEERAMINEGLQATGLSWNSTGDVLGIAYGRADAVVSVAPRGGVAFWNLALSSVNPTKASIAFDTPTAAMAIAFHPKLPSIVAVGGYNGQIFVFDTALANVRRSAGDDKKEDKDEEKIDRSVDDPLLASSPMVDGTHKDAVTSLAWIEATADASSYLLLSIAGDGRMLLWSYEKNGLRLPLASFAITPVMRKGEEDAFLGREKTLGASAMRISSWERGTLVLGAESGGVYKGFISSSVLSSALKEGGNKTPKPSPTLLNFAYAAHDGPVYGVAFSPFNRSLFMTASADSSIQLRHMLHPNPIAVFEPTPTFLYCADFSPARATVFGTGSADGRILLYDLRKNPMSPSLSLDLGTAKEVSAFQSPVLCMAFNRSRTRWLAAGDARGTVRVWSLGDEWVQPKQGDALALRNFMTSVDV